MSARRKMLSQTEITQRILACDQRLEDLVDELEAAGHNAAEADSQFKSDFAQARLSARAVADDQGRRITTDEAEDRATIETQDARRAHLLAANNLTVLREALRATQARMDGLRSLLASQRAAGG